MDNDDYMGKMVDAIEDGKIVRVTEEYAKQEGLFILRKPKQPFDPNEIATRNAIKKRFSEEKSYDLESLRRPLGWSKTQVVLELVENFQWQISTARRSKNISRRQLANAVGESENTIKMLENGILPYNDFILLNKVQEYLGINLRKDGKTFIGSARALVDKNIGSSGISPKKYTLPQLPKKEEGNKNSMMGGKDIEIIETD